MIENTLGPTVRIIHNLARSGATVICKCLGCMDGIILLSEIHPNDLPEMVINQAHQWFDLLTHEDMQQFMERSQGDFSKIIAMLYERCIDRSRTLVIRDWSHRDFTDVMGEPQPSYKLTLVDALKDRFSIVNTALVRHPIDQWLSLRRLPIMQGKITIELFLYGYLRFAMQCADIGFVRYEDFTRDPETQIHILSDRLDINFDSDFMEKWSDFVTISGDNPPSGRGRNEIEPLPRREVEPGLLERFEQNADYIRSLELLGYEHPELDGITDLVPDRQDRYTIP